jgi:hypothetical protein
MAIDLSRRITLDGKGLPSCSLQQLRSSYFDSGGTCAGSLVGRGAVTSEITLPGRAPVMVTGRMLAYYASDGGSEHILGRVVTGEPLRLTYVLPFTILPQRGSFATRLLIRKMRAIRGKCASGHPYCFGGPYSLEEIYGHIAALELNLQRRFKNRGEQHSFVSASCSMPAQLPLFTVRWARVTLGYQGGFKLQQAPPQMCQARG